MTTRCHTCHGPLLVKNGRLVRYCKSACRRARYRATWVAMSRRQTARIVTP